MELRTEGQRLVDKNKFDGNLVFGAKKFHSITNRLGDGKPMNLELTPEWKLCVNDTGEGQYQRKEGMYEVVGVCPVCNSKKRRLLVSRFGLDIYRCLDCTHGYLDPRIKYEEIHKIYHHDKTSADIYKTGVQGDIDSIKYDYGLSLATDYGLESKGKILDIGCGTGLFLERAKKNGFKECVGIDPNKLYLECFKEREGITFHSTDFESLCMEEIGTDFDCMTMWSVLEHIYDPQNFFEQMNKSMKKGGMFVVFVPNTNALSTRLFRSESPIFVWKHVSYWTAESLSFFMEKMGYEVKLVETVISEIGNIRNYLAWDHQYAGEQEKDETFDFITPEFIHKNMLGSSRLMGIFKKK